MTAFAREHEADFVEMVTKKSQSELEKSLRSAKRELEQAQVRIRKLDEIIQRLYEDNVEGKISDERFATLSESYEFEQKTLNLRINELRDQISASQDATINVEWFLTLVRKYSNVQELTAEIVREFVERVYIHDAVKTNGRRYQKIRIIWNCIGEFKPPKKSTYEKSA